MAATAQQQSRAKARADGCERERATSAASLPTELTATDFAYTACYCEENVYMLCRTLAEMGVAHADASDLFVVFISNPAKAVPLWQQRAGQTRERGFVMWDYHVISVQLRAPAALASLPTQLHDQQQRQQQQQQQQQEEEEEEQEHHRHKDANDSRDSQIATAASHVRCTSTTPPEISPSEQSQLACDSAACASCGGETQVEGRECGPSAAWSSTTLAKGAVGSAAAAAGAGTSAAAGFQEVKGDGALVWDLDTLVRPFPSTFLSYVRQSFWAGADRPPDLLVKYQRLFRVIHAPVFLRFFASDRSHMWIAHQNRWSADPPPYPCIVAEDGVLNRMDSYATITTKETDHSRTDRWNLTLEHLKDDSVFKFGAVFSESEFCQMFGLFQHVSE